MEVRISQAELDQICEKAQQEGRREVVDFVESIAGSDRFTATNGKEYGFLSIIDETWQEQKKIWGIRK